MIRCCQGCPHRRAGCHSACPRYRAEREAHLALAERQRWKDDALDVLIEGMRKAKRRWRR